MTKDLIESLICQKCHTNLTLLTNLGVLLNKRNVRHGLAKCKCQTYPILNGILLTRKGKIFDKAFNFVKNNQKWLLSHREVPLFILTLPTTSVICGLLIRITTYFGILNISNRWFGKILVKFNVWSKEWADRVISQKSHNSELVADKIWSKLLDKNIKPKVLDLGCGVGKFLSKYKDIIELEGSAGVDGDLACLDYAVRYQKFEGNLIWADLNESFLMPKNWFNRLVMIDTFQYIKHKIKLLTYLKSISNQVGQIILVGVHNVEFFPNHIPDFQFSLDYDGYIKVLHQKFKIQSTSKPNDKVFNFILS